MSGELQHEVTQILHDWSGGDARAPERLMPFVYDELRRLARAFLARAYGEQNPEAVRTRQLLDRLGATTPKP